MRRHATCGCHPAVKARTTHHASLTQISTQTAPSSPATRRNPSAVAATRRRPGQARAARHRRTAARSLHWIHTHQTMVSKQALADAYTSARTWTHISHPWSRTPRRSGHQSSACWYRGLRGWCTSRHVRREQMIHTGGRYIQKARRVEVAQHGRDVVGTLDLRAWQPRVMRRQDGRAPHRALAACGVPSQHPPPAPSPTHHAPRERSICPSRTACLRQQSRLHDQWV